MSEVSRERKCNNNEFQFVTCKNVCLKVFFSRVYSGKYIRKKWGNIIPPEIDLTSFRPIFNVRRHLNFNFVYQNKTKVNNDFYRLTYNHFLLIRKTKSSTEMFDFGILRIRIILKILCVLIFTIRDQFLNRKKALSV